MNWYVTLADLKDRLDITNTTNDSDLGELIDEVSRDIDRYCRRHFYVQSESRFFDVPNVVELPIDDCLSVTTFATDSELDGTYDGETWTENTDFYLRPDNSWPRMYVWVPSWGTKSLLAQADRYVKITGNWGYGTGDSATPYTASGATINEGATFSASDTTLTVSDGTLFSVGQTALIESEQLFISAISTNNLTVTRGVNGTVAATHADGTAISTYNYPMAIVKAAKVLCSLAWNLRSSMGIMQRRIGGFYEALQSPSQLQDAKHQLLALYVKRTVPV